MEIEQIKDHSIAEIRYAIGELDRVLFQYGKDMFTEFDIGQIEEQKNRLEKLFEVLR